MKDNLIINIPDYIYVLGEFVLLSSKYFVRAELQMCLLPKNILPEGLFSLLFQLWKEIGYRILVRNILIDFLVSKLARHFSGNSTQSCSTTFAHGIWEVRRMYKPRGQEPKSLHQSPLYGK